MKTEMNTKGLPQEIVDYLKESPYWAYGAVQLQWVDGKGPGGSVNCFPIHPPEKYKKWGLSVYVRCNDGWTKYA